MFNLVKIEYGRTNVPEPCLMPVAASLTLTPGTALQMDTTNHVLTVATGDTRAEYVALEEAVTSAGDKILCYRVLPQMVFEVPLYAYSSSTQAVGTRVQFHTDGKSLTATAASDLSGATTLSGSTYTTAVTPAKGAYILDMQSASAAGDKVLVTLA